MPEKTEKEPVKTLNKIGQIDADEYNKIGFLLQDYYEIFMVFWQMGQPVFTDSIETAGVSYDEDIQNIRYYFNPDFYHSLGDYEKAFIVAHEALHIILNHEERFNSIVTNEKARDKVRAIIANPACDIVINEMLFSSFGFQRQNVRLELLREKLEKEDPERAAKMAGKDMICTYEYLDELSLDYKKDMESEYYINLLLHEIKYDENGEGSLESESAYGLIDDHSAYQGKPDDFKEFVEKSVEELSEEGKKEFKEGLLDKIAGKDSGNIVTILNKKKRVRKKKWESVIKDWVIKKTRRVYKDSWIYTDPRYADYFKRSSTNLPSFVWQRHDKKSKIDVLLYLDTSGSCAHLAERFFEAAVTIPPELFEVKVCCFDTKVYETSLKTRKLYGFGGTRFNILEEWIHQQIKSKKLRRYPSGVFVITDGWGNKVNPKYPKRWHWLLSEDNKNCIPNECHTYKLSDFE